MYCYLLASNCSVAGTQRPLRPIQLEHPAHWSVSPHPLFSLFSSTSGKYCSILASMITFFKKKYVCIYLFINICGCFVCVYICTPEEGIGSYRTIVIDCCGLPCGCWELNPEPLKEQAVLFTAEPFLQPMISTFF